MVNCSFCGNEIRRDRFNFVLKIERQDIPRKSNWQTSYESAREDVCAKCFELANSYYRHILENIRKNKGEYKA